MKEEHIKDLIEKYNDGLTSLEEEAVLREQEVNEIASYIKHHKVETLEDLNDKLWEDFDKKITRKNTLKIWFWPVAATIVLFFSLYINNYFIKQTELEKQVLLEEAQRMLEDKKEPETIENILFEDEMLIVYTKTKK